MSSLTQKSRFLLDPVVLFMTFVMLLATAGVFYLPGGDLPFTCADDETYYFGQSRCVNHSAVEEAVVAELQTSDGRMIQDRLVAKTNLYHWDVRLTDDWSDRFDCWRGENARYCELREDGGSDLD